MLKIIILIIAFFLGLSIDGVNDKNNEMIAFFESNILEMKESYKQYYGESWDVNVIEHIYEVFDLNEKMLGYTIIFDNGHLTVSLQYELLSIDTQSRPIKL